MLISLGRPVGKKKKEGVNLWTPSVTEKRRGRLSPVPSPRRPPCIHKPKSKNTAGLGGTSGSIHSVHRLIIISGISLTSLLMKFSCTRDNLCQGLSIVSHATGKNVNLPILQNVLIKAEGGTISLTTTNLEVATYCVVRGKVEENGEFTVPAKLFFDYVSLLPNENVVVFLDGMTLAATCGRNKTKINGLSAADFPLVPRVQGDQAYQIPVEGLREALSRVLFAVATNEARPELTGVSVEFKMTKTGTEVVFAATDSYRLAEATVPLPGQTVAERKVIIPAKTLAEVNRVLSVFRDSVEAPSMVMLGISDNQIVFSYGSVELVSRTIEGNYPDYHQIIPQQFRTQAGLDREDFTKAVKTASLFSKNGLFDVTLAFDPASKQLEVKSVDADRGENVASCGAEATGDLNTVTLNYRYLLDGLSAVGTERVQFQMIDASNPCIVKAQDDTLAYLYIIMPIKQ